MENLMIKMQNRKIKLENYDDLMMIMDYLGSKRMILNQHEKMLSD
jgi:hypothetical protein